MNDAAEKRKKEEVFHFKAEGEGTFIIIKELTQYGTEFSIVERIDSLPDIELATAEASKGDRLMIWLLRMIKSKGSN